MKDYLLPRSSTVCSPLASPDSSGDVVACSPLTSPDSSGDVVAE